MNVVEYLFNMFFSEYLKSVPLGRLTDYFLTSLNHLTPKKILNIIKAEINLVRRTTVCSSLPYHMNVDLTNICQLRCPLCATGQRAHDRPLGIMEFETFKRVVDEIGDYLLLIHFVQWGEPFLNPKALKFFNYAHQKGIGALTSTNFSHDFSQRQIEEIVKSGLDIFVVSLDGITPGVYNKYRVGGNFDLVIKNIKLLVEAKKRFKSKKPFVEWQFLVNKYNEHQIPQLATFAKNLGVDSLVIIPIVILFGQTKHDHLNISDWLPKNKKFRPKDYSLKSNKSINLPIGRCWWLWRSFALSHDGGISSCCYNNSKRLDFGNILENNFRDIWNNGKYRSARSIFKNSKGMVPTICQTCEIVTKKTS